MKSRLEKALSQYTGNGHLYAMLMRCFSDVDDRIDECNALCDGEPSCLEACESTRCERQRICYIRANRYGPMPQWFADEMNRFYKDCKKQSNAP